MGKEYHVDHWALENNSDYEQLEKGAADPYCIERDKCAEYLAERLATFWRKSRFLERLESNNVTPQCAYVTFTLLRVFQPARVVRKVASAD